jgi:hypothetical protein
VSAASVVIADAAYAHHSRAPYDQTREISVEGTVTELEWSNPHIYMTLETESRNGPVLQEIEVMSVAEARATGLRRESIAPGSRVVVRARPGRAGPGARALGLTVATADGAVLPLNADARIAVAPASVEAAGLAGRWAPPVSQFVRFFDPETGGAAATWPLTDAGRAAQSEAFSKMVGGIGMGICEPFPPPWLTAAPWLRTIEIDDATAVIRFDSESGPQERVVRLDQAQHSANVAPTPQGESIGRWEGETLVIDTVGFSSHPLGLGIVPSSPSKHLIERLTLAEDRRHIRYDMTIEDAHFAAPIQFSMLWEHRPDLELSGDACDPQIARRVLEEAAQP